MIHATIGALHDRVPDRQPGVYMVRSGDCYLYVGKSQRCAWRRLREHWGIWDRDTLGNLVVDHDPDSDDWQVAVLPYRDILTLTRAEAHLIRALRPVLNHAQGNDDPWPEWLRWDRFGRRRAQEVDLARRAQAREWSL